MRLLPLLLLPAFSAQAHGHDSQVQPTPTKADVVVFDGGGTRVSLGANAQLMAVPYVGSQAEVANGDASNTAGFAVGGAGLAVSALIGGDVELYIGLDPTSDHTLEDLRVRWMPKKNMAFGLGIAEVPYSRSLSQSSGEMRFISKPIHTGNAAIRHRLGATAEGHYYGGKLSYLLGVYNGTDTLDGNTGGLAYGARIESAPLGPMADLVPTALRMELGAGLVQEDGPSVNTLAYSGDLAVEMAGARLFVEMTMDERSPDVQPLLPATLLGTVSRQVMLAELTAFVWAKRLELAARFEAYDNNRDLEDHGDQSVITGGFNYYFRGHDLKIQGNYIMRTENAGISIDNDAFVLGLAAQL